MRMRYPPIFGALSILVDNPVMKITKLSTPGNGPDLRLDLGRTAARIGDGARLLEHQHDSAEVAAKLLAGAAAVDRMRPPLPTRLDPDISRPVRMVLGIVWYRREDWDRLRQMFPDRKAMHDSFDDWLLDAEKLEGQLQTCGETTERVIIDPDELGAWCKARGAQPNGKMRARYVTEKTRQGGR